MDRLVGCPCCGKVHRVPWLRPRQRARCTRCGWVLLRHDSGRRSAQRTLAAALAALVTFGPAVTFPILEVERLGHHHHASVLSGAVDLILHDDLLVGMVVLSFSVVLPLAKILLLIDLAWLQLTRRRHRALTYRWMERLGRWGMMDVMLLALLVMVVEMGDLVTFHVGPAVVAYVTCVVSSLVASACFDPHAIWQEDAPQFDPDPSVPSPSSPIPTIPEVRA